MKRKRMSSRATDVYSIAHEFFSRGALTSFLSDKWEYSRGSVPTAVPL